MINHLSGLLLSHTRGAVHITRGGTSHRRAACGAGVSAVSATPSRLPGGTSKVLCARSLDRMPRRRATSPVRRSTHGVGAMGAVFVQQVSAWPVRLSMISISCGIPWDKPVFSKSQYMFSITVEQSRYNAKVRIGPEVAYQPGQLTSLSLGVLGPAEPSRHYDRERFGECHRYQEVRRVQAGSPSHHRRPIRQRNGRSGRPGVCPHLRRRRLAHHLHRDQARRTQAVVRQAGRATVRRKELVYSRDRACSHPA
jgi:hypothetical protein